jgi:TctA family transporter
LDQILDQKMSRKLLVALAVYVVLAVMAWFTLDTSISVAGRDVPLRAVTLALLGVFAVRTLLHAQRERVEAGRDRGEHAG